MKVVNLPKNTRSFLKQLLHVSDSVKRSNVLIGLLETAKQLWPDPYVLNRQHMSSTLLQTNTVNTVLATLLGQLAKKQSEPDIGQLLYEQYPLRKRLTPLYETHAINEINLVIYDASEKRYIPIKRIQDERLCDTEHPLLSLYILLSAFVYGNSPLFGLHNNPTATSYTIDLGVLVSGLKLLESLHIEHQNEPIVHDPKRLLSPRIAAIPLLAKRFQTKFEQYRQLTDDKYQVIINTLLSLGYARNAVNALLIGITNWYLTLSAFETLYIVVNLLHQRQYDPVVYSVYALLRPIVEALIQNVDLNNLVSIFEPYETYWQLYYAQIDYPVNLESVIRYYKEQLLGKIQTPQETIVDVLRAYLSKNPKLKASELITETDVQERPALRKLFDVIRNWETQQSDFIEPYLGRFDISLGILTWDITSEGIQGNFTIPLSGYKRISKSYELFSKLDDNLITEKQWLDALHVRDDLYGSYMTELFDRYITVVPVYSIDRMKRLLRTVYAEWLKSNSFDQLLQATVADIGDVHMQHMIQIGLWKQIMEGTIDPFELPKQVQLLLVLYIVFGLTVQEAKDIVRLLSDRPYLQDTLYEYWKPILGMLKLVLRKYRVNRRKAKSLMLRSHTARTDTDKLLLFLLQRLEFCQ